MGGTTELAKLIESTTKTYDKLSADRAHAASHINMVISNTQMYYHFLSAETKRICSKEFSALIGLYHDIGLISLKTKDLDDEGIREQHHILSEKKFIADYKAGVFKNMPFVTPENYLIGAQAIRNHRSSNNLDDESLSEFDKFIRCCDGIQPAKVTLARCALYAIDHNPGASEEKLGKICLGHLKDKYLSKTQHVLKPWMPKWAADIILSEVEKIRSAIDMISGDPVAFMQIARKCIEAI